MSYRLSCSPYPFESPYLHSETFPWSDKESFAEAEKIIVRDLDTDTEATPFVVLMRIAEVAVPSPHKELVTDAWMWNPATRDFVRMF